MAPSSSLDMVPLPSLSNKRNASLYSVKVKKLVMGAIIVLFDLILYVQLTIEELSHCAP